MKIFNAKLTTLSLLVALCGPMAGCSAGDAPIIKANAQQVADMQKLRSLFDSVHGDYSKLSDADKKVFVDYAKGDQSKVDHIWSLMLNPKGGGGGSPTEHFTQGPAGGIYPAGQAPH